MARKTYEERGISFAQRMSKHFEGCVTLRDFKTAIRKYNCTHKIPLTYEHGVSRIAIIRSDYVVKFNFKPTGWFDDRRAGDCESEQYVYEKALRAGMEYLLAKTTVLHLNGLTCCVMPKVEGVGTCRWWERYCTVEEECWLKNNINDLHSNNVGFYKKKVCVIDYAWGRG